MLIRISYMYIKNYDPPRRQPTSEFHDDYYLKIAASRNDLNDGYECPKTHKSYDKGDYEEVTQRLNAPKNQFEDGKRATFMSFKKSVIYQEPDLRKTIKYDLVNVKVPDEYDAIRTHE